MIGGKDGWVVEGMEQGEDRGRRVVCLTLPSLLAFCLCFVARAPFIKLAGSRRVIRDPPSLPRRVGDYNISPPHSRHSRSARSAAPGPRRLQTIYASLSLSLYSHLQQGPPSHPPPTREAPWQTHPARLRQGAAVAAAVHPRQQHSTSSRSRRRSSSTSAALLLLLLLPPRPPPHPLPNNPNCKHKHRHPPQAAQLQVARPRPRYHIPPARSSPTPTLTPTPIPIPHIPTRPPPPPPPLTHNNNHNKHNHKQPVVARRRA